MTPERILLITEGQLGDLLLLTPALRGLKSSYPRSSLTLLIVQRREYAGRESDPPLLRETSHTGTAAMVARLPYVDCVIEVSRPTLRRKKGLRRVWAELEIIRRVRSGAFDAAIACFPEDRFILWGWLSGAVLRAGEGGRPLSWLLTTKTTERKEDAGVLKYYASLARSAGARVEDERTEVVLSDEARRRGREILADAGIGKGDRYAIVHPGASGRYRVWPPERFARAMEYLEGRGIVPLLCGTPFDETAVEAVLRHSRRRPRTVRLSGSVEETAALLEGGVLVLSNDSGPRHLAVALGVPSVAIMPKHNDRAWGIYGVERRAIALTAQEPCPLCPPDRCRDQLPAGEEFGSLCLRMITVESVCAAMEAALKGTEEER